MTSAYYPPQEGESDRPWMGLALLLSIPLLSLILIRMLWSGSELWYLLIGILFLGSAAGLFLARRNNDRGATTLADEPNRLPLVLMGIGIVFVVLLLLPNFSGGSSASVPAEEAQDQSSSLSSSRLSPAVQPTPVRVQPTADRQSNNLTQQQNSSQVQLQEAPADTAPAVQDEVDSSPPAGSETYVVQDGDTLSSIADQFGIGVEAIIAANQLESPDDLQIGDELAIPPASEDEADSSSDGDSSTDTGQ